MSGVRVVEIVMAVVAVARAPRFVSNLRWATATPGRVGARFGLTDNEVAAVVRAYRSGSGRRTARLMWERRRSIVAIAKNERRRRRRGWAGRFAARILRLPQVTLAHARTVPAPPRPDPRPPEAVHVAVHVAAPGAPSRVGVASLAA